MKNLWKQCGWIAATILGSALFAFGFSCFLLPNDISTGGISGLALVAVELLGGGSVGSLSVLINLPLFLVAGLKIGKRFFFGSLTVSVTSTPRKSSMKPAMRKADLTPKLSARSPPKSGPNTVPEIWTPWRVPMAMPIFSLGAHAEVMERAIGSMPAPKPCSALARMSSVGFLTMKKRK